MTSDLTKSTRNNLATSSSGQIDAFLRKASAPPSGRLIFALDATMSRQPTWDRACRLQGGLFDAVVESGGLAVQLVYFRGLGECRASRFVEDTGSLRDLMLKIDCRGGATQIGKVLSHARKATATAAVGALVFIGDAVEEDADALCATAGELGLLGTRCIMIQDGRDTACERIFREIASVSKGAFVRLDEGSPDALRGLLRAAATIVRSGVRALEADNSREAQLLLSQMKDGPRR